MSKKKVCIVTYSHSKNYGAALQLYATYKEVEKLGLQPVVLEYVNEYEFSNKMIDVLRRANGLKAKIRTFISSYFFQSIKNGINNFDKFYSKMTYTLPVYNVNELKKFEDIDVFMVGSDQVWNPLITGEYDPVFLLNDKQLKRKKISYSSSMGSINGSEWDKEVLVEALGQFDKLAVREKVAQEYLQKKLDKDIKVTLDPTLLFNQKDWKSIMSISNIEMKEKYVLIYALGGHFEELNILAHKIAKKIGAKVAAITLSNVYKKVDYKITTAMPEDFVQLVFNAEFVVTNSFHGTCFSIIGETPFYSVYFDSNPKRVEDLLSKYGLLKRLVKIDAEYTDDALCIEDIRSANEKIEIDRQDSLKWLEDAIND